MRLQAKSALILRSAKLTEMPEVIDPKNNTIVVFGDHRIDKSSIIQGITQVSFTDGVYHGILSTKYYSAPIRFHSLSLSDLAAPIHEETVKNATACIFIYDHTPEGFSILTDALKSKKQGLDHMDTSLVIALSQTPIENGDRLWLHARALAVDANMELVSVIHPSVSTATGVEEEKQEKSTKSGIITYSASESANAFDIAQPTDASGDCDDDERRGLARVREALECCSWPHMEMKTQSNSNISSRSGNLTLSTMRHSDDLHEGELEDAGDSLMLSDLAALCVQGRCVEQEDDSAEGTTEENNTATSASAEKEQEPKKTTQSNSKAKSKAKTTKKASKQATDDDVDLDAFEKLVLQAQSVRAKAMAGVGSVESRKQDAARVAMMMAKALGLGGDDEDFDLSQLLDS